MVFKLLVLLIGLSSAALAAIHSCADSSTNCARYAHQCGTNAFVQANCEQTCGICNEIITSETTAPETKEPEIMTPEVRKTEATTLKTTTTGTTKVIDSCSDVSSKCAQYAAQCGTNAFVQGRCKKTCGLCKESPTCASRGGVVIGTQCLAFVEEAIYRDGARSACTSKGGALASLDDPQAVLDHATTIGFTGWVGASDEASEGSWIWDDGRVLDASQLPWGNWEPNDGGREEDCLWVHSGHGGYADVHCEWEAHYVCDLGAFN